MTIYEIRVFDDGLKRFEKNTNRWIVIDTKFNGGKVTLKNIEDTTIIIRSISSWKIRAIKTQVCL
jgi:hypothetical protein